MSWKHHFNQPFLCNINVQLQVCWNMRFPMLWKQFWNIIFWHKFKSGGNNKLQIKFRTLPESKNFSRSEMVIMPISDLSKFLLSEEYLKFYLEFIVSAWLKFRLKNDILELVLKHQKSHILAHLKLHICVSHRNGWLK